MLKSILQGSIAQRWLVVIATILLTLWGLRTLTQMPLDVLPNFAPPQVEIQTEATGLAPEEVESLVTLVIESTVNGTPGVINVRSSSVAGISVVKVTFGWGTDIYQARQLIAERLQQVQSKLPTGIGPPQISPVSALLGEILKYAFTSETTPLMELTRMINGSVTNRLLAVPGVSQVVAWGGDVRQYQVLVDPEKLKAFDVSWQEVAKAAAAANVNAPGGFLINPSRELLIRGLGRIESVEQLKQSVITERNGIPILLGNVADVQIGAALKRNGASLDGKKAVVLVVNKQPGVDTPTVTRAVEAAMTEIKPGLPKDAKVTVTFRQADYIEASIQNLVDALRDGMIIVSVVVLLFLMNWRTAIISLSALPLSLILGLMVMSWLGQGINTMTLGGLAVAIGSVVDDAIVDVENVYRRLRENQLAGNPVSPLQVVFKGSVEVRVSILFSTVIIAVVFTPIFALSGVEGRIFTPMGVAYLLSLLASTLVAFTLTPALCALLLVKCQLPEKEPWLSRASKQLYRPALMFSLRHSKLVLLAAAGCLLASIVVLPNLGREFLPEFRERALVVTTYLFPGVSLDTTNQVGWAIEDTLKHDPRFETLQFRSGTALGANDVNDVNFGELDVGMSQVGLPHRESTIETLRTEFAKLPGVVANISGFISERIDEVVSGSLSAIAVKIYGVELEQLRHLADQVQSAMSTVEGIVDLQLEPQMSLKQLQIQFDRSAAARYGLTMGELADTIQTALKGRVVSQVLEQQQLFDLLVQLPESARDNLETIRTLLIDTPNGQKIPLAQVAQINYGSGPNIINRENVSRLTVVSANVAGRDLQSVITDIRDKVKQQVQLPTGYFIEYGGQFKSAEQATQSLLFFGTLAFVSISVLIYFTVRSVTSTAMILLNLPLALVGGVISVVVTGGIISVASMVGFITLFGVATRNGLLLVDNYNTKLATAMPLRRVLIEGSLERLTAVLMTALASALGMLPLVIGSGAGKEILQPLAIVVLGGLFTSTALTLLVLPALYSQFGRFLVPKETSLGPQMEVGSVKALNHSR